MKKSKFYKDKLSFSSIFSQGSWSYTQVSKDNVNNIIKIKDNFLNLSNKKVKKVYRILNNFKKKRLKLNIMTKDLSRKQVIVLIDFINFNRLIITSNKHFTNINRVFKNIKSDVMADFIWANHKEIVITTNKVVNTSDLNTIGRYIKNVDAINLNKIMSPMLS